MTYITQREFFPNGTPLTEFTLHSGGREIASIFADREGSVTQLRYASKETYSGPESTRALAELLTIAADHAEGK